MNLLTKRDLAFVGYAAAILGWRLVPRSRRLQACTSVARQLGALWYRLDRQSSALARTNLRSVLGHRLSAEAIDVTARALFQNVALRVLLQDMVVSLSLRELNQVLSIRGEQHLERALTHGKGVILLGTHCGLIPGYTPLALLERLGYQAGAVLGEEVETEDTWLYRHLILPIRRRSRSHWCVIEPTGRPQRTMAERLRQNHILIILGDVLDEDLRFLQTPAPHLLPAPLLGHTVPLRTGPFRLARWLNAPVVPCFTVPREQGGFELIIDAPLPLSEDTSVGGLMADLAAFTARFEPYILRYPETWLHWRHGSLMKLMQSVPDDLARRHPLETATTEGNHVSAERATVCE
jgi:lauroyl/myristoyl acyltransferase